MKTNKKILIIISPILIIFLIFILLFLPGWPSKKQLCMDVSKYISENDCMRLENKYVVILNAFPEDVATQEQVYEALNKYYDEELSAAYGKGEYYYINRHPIGFISKSFRRYDSFHFYYDENGVVDYVFRDDQ